MFRADRAECSTKENKFNNAINKLDRVEINFTRICVCSSRDICVAVGSGGAMSCLR